MDVSLWKTRPFAPLVTDHFDIRRMEEVYRCIDDNPEKVMKVVIDVGD
jgi:hypothetical protein